MTLHEQILGAQYIALLFDSYVYSVHSWVRHPLTSVILASFSKTLPFCVRVRSLCNDHYCRHFSNFCTNIMSTSCAFSNITTPSKTHLGPGEVWNKKLTRGWAMSTHPSSKTTRLTDVEFVAQITAFYTVSYAVNDQITDSSLPKMLRRRRAVTTCSIALIYQIKYIWAEPHKGMQY